MSDELKTVTCPNCGETESLEMTDWEDCIEYECYNCGYYFEKLKVRK